MGLFTSTPRRKGAAVGLLSNACSKGTGELSRAGLGVFLNVFSGAEVASLFSSNATRSWSDLWSALSAIFKVTPGGRLYPDIGDLRLNPSTSLSLFPSPILVSDLRSGILREVMCGNRSANLWNRLLGCLSGFTRPDKSGERCRELFNVRLGGLPPARASARPS